MRDEELRAKFSYDHETGIITRISSTNRGSVGPVTTRTKHDGYLRVCVGRKEYVAHRLAWFLHFGVWPDREIDHINQQRDDNRLANMRLATRSQNMANRRGNGASLKGVTLHKSGRYQAQIKVHGRNLYLGLYETELDAHAAYCLSAQEHFGEFARAA